VFYKWQYLGVVNPQVLEKHSSTSNWGHCFLWLGGSKICRRARNHTPFNCCTLPVGGGVFPDQAPITMVLILIRLIIECTWFCHIHYPEILNIIHVYPLLSNNYPSITIYSIIVTIYPPCIAFWESSLPFFPRQMQLWHAWTWRGARWPRWMSCWDS
jgi:hypothetical protein